MRIASNERRAQDVRNVGISGLAADAQSTRMTPNGHRDAFAERHLWNVHAFPASVRLDTGEPDHLGPFLGFLGDMLGELRG
jgi:hypothetical protein